MNKNIKLLAELIYQRGESIRYESFTQQTERLSCISDLFSWSSKQTYKSNYTLGIIHFIELNQLCVCNLDPQYKHIEICGFTENVNLLFNPVCHHLQKTEISVKNCGFVVQNVGTACDHWSWAWAAGYLSSQTHIPLSEIMLMAEASLCSLGKGTSRHISSNKIFWVSTEVTFQGGIWIQIN